MRKKGLLALILSAVLVFMLVPAAVFAKETNAVSLTELKNALSTAVPGDAVIVTAYITVPAGQSVVIPDKVDLKINASGTLNVQGDLDIQQEGKIIILPGAAFILRDEDGNDEKLVGNEADALFTLTDGEMVYSKEDRGWGPSKILTLSGKAKQNRSMIGFMADEPLINRFIVGSGSVLTVDSEVSLFFADVYGTVKVTASGHLSTFGGHWDRIRYCDSGKTEIAAGGRLSIFGPLFFGPAGDSDAIIQIISGSAFYGAGSDGERRIYIDGEAKLNSPYEGSEYFLANQADRIVLANSGKLTVGSGVRLSIPIEGGTVIGAYEKFSFVEDFLAPAENTTVVGNTTKATITAPAVDTSGASAANKMEVLYYVGDVEDVIREATKNTVKFEIVIPKNVLENEFVELKDINVPWWDAFETAKEENKSLEFDIKDSSGKLLYSWTFENSKIRDEYDFWMINLHLETGGDLPKALPDADNALLINFKHDGDLPVTSAGVKIYVGNQGYKAGDKVSFYYYNPEKDKYDLIAENLIVDADGYVTVTITHCSDYMLSRTTIKGDINDDGLIDVEDLLLLKKHILKLDVFPAGSYKLNAADVNNDGAVDVEDLLLVKKYVLKLISKF